MCFPGLLVKVRRYQSCRTLYRDLNWEEQPLALHGDLSELLRHEVDHLDGVPATMRTMGGRSLPFRGQACASHHVVTKVELTIHRGYPVFNPLFTIPL